MIDSITSSEFVSRVRTELASGYTFIPFIGSGLSAKSGILMGQDFGDYLAYVVYRVTAPAEEQRKQGVAEFRLNLQQAGWPERPTSARLESARKWFRDHFTRILREQYGIKVEDGKLTPFPESAERKVGAGLLHSRPLTPGIFEQSVDHWWGEVQRENAARSAGHIERLYLPHLEIVASPTSEDYIIEEAIRALFDWRRVLRLLATVFPSGNHSEIGSRGRSFTRFAEHTGYRADLPDYDQSIIDAFHLHITSGKEPNLGHMSLAHLARPMRLRQIITTNFDTLIEESFRKLKLPHIPIEVHLGGLFPDPATLRHGPCVLKMHGGAHETRADNSLLEHPSEGDKARFRQLLHGFDSNDRATCLPSHLIVLGYSGEDARTVQLIKHTLDNSTLQSTKVFWVAFGTHDISRLKRIFREPEYCPHLVVTQTMRPDLLLYELYQELTHSLPGGGLSYEFSHKVPPTLPRHTRSRSGEESKKIAKELGETIFSGTLAPDEVKAQDFSQNDIAFIDLLCDKQQRSYTLDMGSGAIRILADLHRIVSQGEAKIPRKRCLWLELDDYASPREVFEDCFRLIAMDLGLYHSEHREYTLKATSELATSVIGRFPDSSSLPPTTVETPAYEKCLKFYDRLLNGLGVKPDEWCFFFYGRNLPGSASGFKASYWKADAYETFTAFRGLLSKLGCWSVYLPYAKCRMQREAMKLNFVDQLARTALSLDRSENSAVWMSELRREGYWDDKLDDDVKRISRYLAKDGPNTEETAAANDRLKRAADAAASSDLGFAGVRYRPIGDLMRAGPLDRSHYENALKDYIDPAFSRRVRDRNIENNYHTQYRYEREIIMSALAEWLFNHDGPQPGLASPLAAIANCNFWDRKLQFLYAASLFRQPRHISAFYTHAAFPCPYRYNLAGIDNDVVRGQLARRWIGELENRGVFLKKQGGYCWKYRDVRIGIRSFLERIQPLVLPRSSPAGRVRSLDNSVQFRAHTHHWIAVWYERAFMATGNPSPLIESMYHRLEAIRSSCYAKPPSIVFNTGVYANNPDRYSADVALYRIELASASLCALAKLLVIGEASVRAWRPVSEHDNVFSDETSDYLFSSYDSPLRSLATLLQQVAAPYRSQSLKLLADNIAFSSQSMPTVIRKAYRSLPIFGPLVDDFFRVYESFRKGGFKSVSRIDRNGSTRAEAMVETAILSSNTANNNERVPERQRLFGDTPHISERTKWCANVAPPDKWVDWFRAFGSKRPSSLDGIEFEEALRARGLHDEVLVNKLRKFEEDARDMRTPTDFRTLRLRELPAYEMAGVVLGIAGIHENHAPYNIGDEIDQTTLEDRIAGLSELAYQYLLRTRIEDVAKQRSSKVFRSAYPFCHFRWAQVSLLCRIGIDMCRHLRANSIEFETSQLVKMHTMYGVALAHLGRHLEANRHFNDATARLSQSPFGLDDVELAIVRLRRCEALLVQSIQIVNLLERIAEFRDGDKRIDAWFRVPEDVCHAPDKLATWVANAQLERTAYVTELSECIRGLQFVWMNHHEVAVPSSQFGGIPAVFATETVEIRDIKEADEFAMKLLSQDAMGMCESMHRLAVASLDDSIVMLDSAEQLLCGKNHTKLWWLLHHALTIKIFETGTRLTGIASRHRGGAIATFLSNRRDPLGRVTLAYERSLNLASDDNFRRLRIMAGLVDGLTSVRKHRMIVQAMTPHVADSVWWKDMLSRVKSDLSTEQAELKSLTEEHGDSLFSQIVEYISERIKDLKPETK